MIRVCFPILLLASAFSAVCAETNRSWDRLLDTIRPGKSVVVAHADGRQIEGKLLAIDADSMTVRWHKQPYQIRREEVFRVRYANVSAWHTLVGMAGGAVIGAIVIGGVNMDKNVNVRRPLDSILGAGLGALGGAIIGAVLPIGKPLYEIPLPSRKGGLSAGAGRSPE